MDPVEGMMFGAAFFLMALTAAMENRSRLRWGAFTLALCVAGNFLLPFAYVGIAAGLLLSFTAMFACNLLRNT